MSHAYVGHCITLFMGATSSFKAQLQTLLPLSLNPWPDGDEYDSVIYLVESSIQWLTNATPCRVKHPLALTWVLSLGILRQMLIIGWFRWANWWRFSSKLISCCHFYKNTRSSRLSILLVSISFWLSQLSLGVNCFCTRRPCHSASDILFNLGGTKQNTFCEH